MEEAVISFSPKCHTEFAICLRTLSNASQSSFLLLSRAMKPEHNARANITPSKVQKLFSMSHRAAVQLDKEKKKKRRVNKIHFYVTEHQHIMFSFWVMVVPSSVLLKVSYLGLEFENNQVIPSPSFEDPRIPIGKNTKL